MIPSLPINEHCHIYSCWLAARHSQARIHMLNSQTAALVITVHNLPRPHLHRSAQPPNSAKVSLHSVRSHLSSTADGPKSP